MLPLQDQYKAGLQPTATGASKAVRNLARWHVIDVRTSMLPPFYAMCGRTIAVGAATLQSYLPDDDPRCAACEATYKAALTGHR